MPIPTLVLGNARISSMLLNMRHTTPHLLNTILTLRLYYPLDWSPRDIAPFEFRNILAFFELQNTSFKMEFHYKPLERNEIRLLKPVAQTSSQLSFELVHKSLSSKLRYVALSYAWVSSKSSITVLVSVTLILPYKISRATSQLRMRFNRRFD
jgi:hypothetical protein